MDEKIKTWPLSFPAKDNPNMEQALFDWPIDQNITDFLRPKSKERVKREKTGLFDIGNGLAGKRNKKTPLILIPSTTSTKWNLPGKPMD